MNKHTETTKEKVLSLFKQVIGASEHYNMEIAPVLGMFSDKSGVALKTIKAPKEMWGDVILSSSREYMRDTQKLVNGVILINEARMTQLKSKEDQAKIMHYMSQFGSLDGCPYTEVIDVAICSCTLRNFDKILFWSKITIDEDKKRTFSEIEDIELADDKMGASGIVIDISEQLFHYNLNDYDDLEA